MAVISVIMRPENSVNMTDVVGKHLLPHIAGRIDQQALSIITFNQN
jgi:hypothetical protein